MFSLQNVLCQKCKVQNDAQHSQCLWKDRPTVKGVFLLQREMVTGKKMEVKLCIVCPFYMFCSMHMCSKINFLEKRTNILHNRLHSTHMQFLPLSLAFAKFPNVFFLMQFSCGYIFSLFPPCAQMYAWEVSIFLVRFPKIFSGLLFFPIYHKAPHTQYLGDSLNF